MPQSLIDPQSEPRARRSVGLVVLVIAALLLAVMLGLYYRSAALTNHVALSSQAKPVSTVRAKAGEFRPTRQYVGTLDPWALAKVGPQYVSAYIGTVLVRPGAVVKRGQVLATLDCRNSSAESREIAARAKALEQRRAAALDESARVKQLSAGGFASANEAEQLAAKSSAEAAEVESLQASLVSKSLAVDDCVLRAPFSGEVNERLVDPGAYARPGKPIVTLIDRSTVRVTADAPESDFAIVAPGTPVEIAVEATGAKLRAEISRRAPAADEITRTIHFEIDVPNADRVLPVGTTAVISIEVGKNQPATVVPLESATVRGEKAILFAVKNGAAKRIVAHVLGEAGGSLFLDGKPIPGTPVVLEGRALLDDGDKVRAKEMAE
jgi:RND family efflux transporter MFP subunit